MKSQVTVPSSEMPEIGPNLRRRGGMVTLHFDVNNLSRTVFREGGGGHSYSPRRISLISLPACLYIDTCSSISLLCVGICPQIQGVYFFFCFRLMQQKSHKTVKKKKRQYCEFNNWHEEWDILSNPVSLPLIRFIDFLLTILVELY